MIDQHANSEGFDLYALGALDGEEKRKFEAHLRDCPECRGQLAEARRRVSLLALSTAPIVPPPALKSALMARIHSESGARTGPAVAVEPRRRRWGLRFSFAFAACTVVLAFACYWLGKANRQHEQEIHQLRADLDAAQGTVSQDASAMRSMADVVAAPDTISVVLQQQTGGPPGQAHVLYNQRMGVAVYSGEIAPAPAGKSYQLWLVPASGSPVSAGLVAENQQNGAVVAHLEQGLSARAFAVTLEPQGGSPQPTGPKVLVGALNG